MVNNPNEPEKVVGNLTVYRFCCVPFGIVCSPFLLEATLKFHLKKEGSAIAKMIRDNIYLDPFVIYSLYILMWFKSLRPFSCLHILKCFHSLNILS